MISIYDIRRENARTIIDKYFDGSQSKLARALGYENASFVSRLVSSNPTTQKNIGPAIARKIEEASGVSEFWLDQNHQNVEQSPPLYTIDNNNNQTNLRLVPVISWVQAGSWEEIEDPHQPGVAEDWMPSPIKCSSSTFVLRVRGASMEPRFHDGDLIVVDPQVEARNKSFVIVRMDDSKEATFKQLILEGDRRYLKPLNPQWPDPIIEINGNATISGVVVFKGEKI